MLNLKSSEVRRFVRAAELHCEAAFVLFGEMPERGESRLGHDTVYLAGYVVECSMKALYLTRTPQRKHAETVAWFKSDLKHNLERLRAELNHKGVVFTKEVRSRLRIVVTNWSSEMRYAVLSWDRESVARVLDAAAELFEWVRGES